VFFPPPPWAIAEWPEACSGELRQAPSSPLAHVSARANGPLFDFRRMEASRCKRACSAASRFASRSFNSCFSLCLCRYPCRVHSGRNVENCSGAQHVRASQTGRSLAPDAGRQHGRYLDERVAGRHVVSLRQALLHQRRSAPDLRGRGEVRVSFSWDVSQIGPAAGLANGTCAGMAPAQDHWAAPAGPSSCACFGGGSSESPPRARVRCRRPADPRTQSHSRPRTSLPGTAAPRAQAPRGARLTNEVSHPPTISATSHRYRPIAVTPKCSMRIISRYYI